jgi:hypothetical protein
MKMPFKVYDGKKTRHCDFTDLFIIVTFGLDFTLYQKRSLYGIPIMDKKLPDNVVYVLFAAVKAIREMNRMYPVSYLNIVHIIHHHQISKLYCKELYEWKKNRLIRLIVKLEL